MAKKLNPIHPGAQLREEFMVPLNLSSNALARALDVTPARINDQWRICFVWSARGPEAVAIVDYH